MNSATNAYPEKLAPKQAAAVIGITARTLAEWRKRRIGPPWRQRETRRIYYMRSDIEDWESGHARHPRNA